MPPFRNIIAVIAVLVTASTCTAFGFWQLGRHREREAANTVLRAALAAPPRSLPPGVAPDPAKDGPGRWTVRGRFDEARQFLLIGRSRDGYPGVHVVTPLLRDDGGPAVLVDRGFVPADDAATAMPPAEPDTMSRAVTGLVAPILPRPGNSMWQASPSARMRLWSTRWLVADSVASALPYPVTAIILRELEDEGVPAMPARSRAELANTSMHLSYAGQWFFFALVALVGPFFLARARRRPAEDS